MHRAIALLFLPILSDYTQIAHLTYMVAALLLLLSFRRLILSEILFFAHMQLYVYTCLHE